MNESYELERVRDGAAIRQLGVRVIIMRGGTFVDLQKSVEAVLGEEANALLYEAGIRAGTSSTQILLRRWGRENFMKRWADFYGSRGCGWFKLEEAKVDPERGGVIKLSSSFIAEGYGRSEKPVCHFLCGFLVGVFQELLGIKLACEEIRCAATGEPYCEFKLERYEGER